MYAVADPDLDRGGGGREGGGGAVSKTLPWIHHWYVF